MSAVGDFLFGYRPIYQNCEIGLVIADESPLDPSCGILDGYTFYIYPHHSRHKAGYISLRLGESPSLYYLGHIGYRIEPEFRGHRYAAQSCGLLFPLMRELRLYSVVITNNVDNLPSRRTCEILGCTLESITHVPQEFRFACSGATEKCRYILRIPRA